MKNLNLLAIDDDEMVLESLRLALPEGWNLTTSQKAHWPEKPLYHCAFVDMHLSGSLEKTEGLEAIAAISKEHPSCEIVAVSGDINTMLMEDSLRYGADRFLSKPFSKQQVEMVLAKVVARWQLRGVGRSPLPTTPWIGTSQASQKIRQQIANLVGERMPILIEGESGTGKEVVAQILGSQGQPRPFVSVNVAAIPKDLFESVFFGHRKGAFTGAVQNQMGLVEKAHGGDLFLDEIEALAPEHQAKLLRFLESGEYLSLGSDAPQKSSVRILASTNQSLEMLESKQLFRKDLRFRLEGEKVFIPPLRERREDIADLVPFFLKSPSLVFKKDIDSPGIRLLQEAGWPGNVRELKRCVERLVLGSPLPLIREEDVRKILKNENGGKGMSDADFNSPFDTLEGKGLAEALNLVEKSLLQQSVDESRDVEFLIKKLKISRSSLYKKLKDHGISLERR